jgi:hypothetical protein
MFRKSAQAILSSSIIDLGCYISAKMGKIMGID